MLEPVVFGERLSRMPYNDSKAKQHWSFPHNIRFRSRPRSYITEFTTSAVLTSTAKLTNIDRSQRFKSLGKRRAPSPGTYPVTKKWAGPFISFGLSREQVKTIDNVSSSANNVGPGAFDPKTTDSSIGITLKSRVPLRTSKPGEVGPSPDAYDPLRGFTVTKKRVIGGKFLGCPKMPHKVDNDLGPGHYDLSKSYMNPSGKYPSSLVPNISTCSMGNAKGLSSLPAIRNAPGPYDLPSDFGIYRSSKKENRAQNL